MTTKTASPEAIKTKVLAIINSSLWEQLWARWQDEKEYEDIKEYGKAIAKNFKCNTHKCIKRPFGFVISFDEFPEGRYEIQGTARSNRWRRID